jgi:REP element-mobilizing transposase RayT
MIIAYHAIFTTYGTWLPNDPRGSYSKAVYNEELAALGEIRYGRQNPQPNRCMIRRFRAAAAPRLSRPPYYLSDHTRLIVADAFQRVVERLCLNVPACAIMNDHVHFLVWRSKYTIEYIVNQLKGAATLALELPATPWARNCWKVFINDESSLRAAARYVAANPAAAGLASQSWPFVKPLPPDD